MRTDSRKDRHDEANSRFSQSCETRLRHVKSCLSTSWRYIGWGGGRCIPPVVLNFGTRWKWMVNFTPRPLYPRVSAAGLDVLENRKPLVRASIETPDRPAPNLVTVLFHTIPAPWKRGSILKFVCRHGVDSQDLSINVVNSSQETRWILPELRTVMSTAAVTRCRHFQEWLQWVPEMRNSNGAWSERYQSRDRKCV
jgi:hypothetical protein